MSRISRRHRRRHQRRDQGRAPDLRTCANPQCGDSLPGYYVRPVAPRRGEREPDWHRRGACEDCRAWIDHERAIAFRWFENHNRSVPSADVAAFARWLHRSIVPGELADLLLLIVEAFARLRDRAAGVDAKWGSASDDELLASFTNEHAELLASMQAQGARLKEVRLPSERISRLKNEIYRVRETSRRALPAGAVLIRFSDGTKAQFVPDDEPAPHAGNAKT